MNNIPALFQSKRFWSAVGTFIAMLWVAYDPQFESIQAILIPAIAAVGYGLINGYTREDVATIERGISAVVERTPTTLDNDLWKMIIGQGGLESLGKTVRIVVGDAPAAKDDTPPGGE